MVDRLTKERRSWNMGRIKGSNTQPERIVRSLLHRMGFRFRLHRRDLPGKPDIVLPRYRVVLFVHGCFWHRHPQCRFAYQPKSRGEFWSRKFRENVARDRRQKRELQKAGWRAEVIWECELRDLEKVESRLQRFLCRSESSDGRTGR